MFQWVYFYSCAFNDIKSLKDNMFGEVGWVKSEKSGTQRMRESWYKKLITEGIYFTFNDIDT